MSDQNCPCGAGFYRECCQPLHLGQVKAQTAVQLMRSRYSAFAKQQIDYLIQTTALGQQSALDRVAIADWSKANQWLKLEIVRSNEKLDKNHAQVEFKAHYHDGQQLQIHHEISHFVNYQDVWYFLDPTTEMQKKFKQCCAEYL